MYCKNTYAHRTSKCATTYFHDDKENLYSAFHTRMQTNQDQSCQNGTKGSYNYPFSSQAKLDSFDEEWQEQLLRDSCCTDYSKRTRSGDEAHSSETSRVDMLGNFVPVYTSTRNIGQRFVKGSMYGCDQINVENIPFSSNANNRKSNVNDPQANTAVSSSKKRVENCAASKECSSNYFANCNGYFDQRSCPAEPERLTRAFGNSQTDCNVDHKSSNENAQNVGHKSENNKKGFTKDTDQAKFTGNIKFRTSFEKIKTASADSKSASDKHEVLKPEGENKQEPKHSKTEGVASIHSATEHNSHRPKLPKGLKRMAKRRGQKKLQTHDARLAQGSTKSGGVEEWMLFVLDQMKKGVATALSWIPDYLSIGWSLLVYIFIVIVLLLVSPVLSCIWTCLKICCVYLWDVTHSLWKRFSKKFQRNSNKASQKPTRRPVSCQTSDSLPDADELVSRLLVSKDLDAYEVIGVSPSATDEEIKRKYRDMAKIVHPDKNPHEKASEAFQILQSAFEDIGDEEKRMAYQFNSDRKRFQEEVDEFFEKFMDQMEEMKNKIMCSSCRKSHPRLPTDRLMSSARYCSQCGVRHGAKEGDVWVETSHMGFKYYCYLCLHGEVYEVTEWGSCQGLLRLKPNSHIVFVSVKSNHSPWDEMFAEGDRSNYSSGNNKKKRKSKGKSNKTRKR